MTSARVPVHSSRTTSTATRASMPRTVDAEPRDDCSGAIRFDTFQPASRNRRSGRQTLTPNRNITFPARTTSTGRTSPTAARSRTTCSATARRRSRCRQQVPARPDAQRPRQRTRTRSTRMVKTATRAWNDANGNFTPGLRPAELAANGECGRCQQPAVRHGSRDGAVRSDDLLSGFNHRQTNWEFSAGVQHEIMPRVGDGRRLLPPHLGELPGDGQPGPRRRADFDAFSMVVPDDPHLPSGGGYTLDGLLRR